MAVMPARSPGRTPFPLGHWPWGDSFDPPLESFALPPLGGDKFGEGDSIAGKAAPLLEGLSRISKLLSQLCPEAVPSSVASDSRTCQFEGLFSNLVKPPKEPFAPVLFRRVSELLALSRAKFTTSAAAGKATVSALPFKKRPLAVSSDPVFGRAAVANPALPRIIGNLPPSRSAGVQFFELARMESVARQALRPSPLRWSPLRRPRLL